MADNGTLAVVTEDVSAMAELLIYNSNMEQVLSWSMSSNDGTPLRMAFSPTGGSWRRQRSRRAADR